jgi:hypothetical protein
VRKLRAVDVDTQKLRNKLVEQLNDIFHIASKYARGEVERITDEEGKQRALSMAERQFLARIAAYVAQVAFNVSKGIDQRQMDKDLDELERLLNAA